MKTITKDTKVSVDVRRCTEEQRGLVIDHFSRLVGETSSYRQEAVEDAVIVSLNYSSGWSYTSSGDHYNQNLISFKKFLKAINPYKSGTYYVAFKSDKKKKKIIKRLEQMGYTKFDACDGSGAILFDQMMDWFERRGPGSDSSYTKLDYEQFMNMEPSDQTKLLKFNSWDVIVNDKSIRIGCKTIDKEAVRKWFELSSEIVEHISLDDTHMFLRDNRDKLEL